MIDERDKVCRLCDWSSGDDDSGLVFCNNPNHENAEAWHSANENSWVVSDDSTCTAWVAPTGMFDGE